GIHLSTKVTKVAEEKTGIRVWFDGEAPDKEMKFDKVLVSVGRRPNTAHIGLDRAGVEVDGKGFVTVDPQRRTNVEHIFAIGDAAGEPMLAHKASHEGKLAACVIAGDNLAWDKRGIPAVVFTDPEIAWVGITESEAKKQKLDYDVGKFRWAASGRAATLGR